MGSYEILIKTEDIRKTVQEGDLLSALNILDTIDLRKVKNLSDLNLMAGVYKENCRYEEAAELYLRIYERSKTRKTIASLIDIFIRMDDIDEAEKYFAQYAKYTDEDFEKHIFRFKLDKMLGASYEALIQSLEKLKKLEYSEKWAYELAKLYYKAGMEEACTKECADIILWFGEGIYVEKAKLLRSYYTGGTSKEKILEELKRRAGVLNSDSSIEISKESKESEEKKESEEGKEPEERMEMEAFEEVAITIDQSLFDEEVAVEELTAQDKISEAQLISLEEETGLSAAQEEETGLSAAQEAEAELSAVQEEAQLCTIQEEPESRAELEVELAEEVLESERIATVEEGKLFLDIENTYGIKLEDIFDEFLKIESIQLQLTDILKGILEHRIKPLILLLVGTSSEDKLNLSKDLALFMNKINALSSPRIAKISANKLNSIDLSTKKEMLQGCCMVVEQAETLTKECLKNILLFENKVDGDFSVILMVNTEQEEELLCSYEEVSSLQIGIMRMQE